MTGLLLDFLSVTLPFIIMGLAAAALVGLHDALARWWNRGLARRRARLNGGRR